MPSPAPRPSSSPQPAANDSAAESRPRAKLFDLPRVRNAEPSQRWQLIMVGIVTVSWFASLVWAASFWFDALADAVGLVAAIFFIGGLALVPSTVNMFVVASLLMDRRPPRRALARYPALSVLMYVRDSAQSIGETIESIRRQEYPGPFEVILIDDASTDRTAYIVRGMGYRWIKVLRQTKGRGKAAALNRALEWAQHDLIVTLDADAILFGDALWSMVERYVAAEPDVRAISGCVLVRNSRENWLTRAQEWDYFHGVASMKRMQSQYQGTVVAEAAFTIYDRAALKEVGGWRSDVAEDVLLTWDMLQRGWRVGFAEDACCFVIVPADVKSFIQQRVRHAKTTLRALRELPPNWQAQVDALRRLAPAVPVDRSRVHARLRARSRSVGRVQQPPADGTDCADTAARRAFAQCRNLLRDALNVPRARAEGPAQRRRLRCLHLRIQPAGAARACGRLPDGPDAVALDEEGLKRGVKQPPPCVTA